METFFVNLPFVRGIHRSPVNCPHKGQWRGALIFSLICARINHWVYNGEAGDLRCHRAHYDVTVMREESTGGQWTDVCCRDDNLRCHHWRQSDVNFAATGGTVCCHGDNLWCNQWRHAYSWHHDNFQFSATYSLTENKVHGPTWGPPGSCGPQMGPMLSPWILLSGLLLTLNSMSFSYLGVR